MKQMHRSRFLQNQNELYKKRCSLYKKWAPFSSSIIEPYDSALLVAQQWQKSLAIVAYLVEQAVVFGNNDACSGKSTVHKPFQYSSERSRKYTTYDRISSFESDIVFMLLPL